ncbi:MAG: hypothetical protein FJ290_28990 [Planctomycetes bacterium]|nr:hypothetical protein [Planctomycetota bacterium]
MAKSDASGFLSGVQLHWLHQLMARGFSRQGAGELLAGHTVTLTGDKARVMAKAGGKDFVAVYHDLLFRSGPTGADIGIGASSLYDKTLQVASLVARDARAEDHGLDRVAHPWLNTANGPHLQTVRWGRR